MNKIKVITKNIIIGNQAPKISISNRFKKLDNEQHLCLDGDQTFISNAILSPADSIQITLTDREHVNDSTVQTTIQIKEIFIDEINLQHLIFQGVFYPDYDHNFFNEYKPDVSFCPGTQMYTNGVFELQIGLPISKFLINSYEQKS